MAKYKMVKNAQYPIGPHSDHQGKTYSQANSIIESPHPLDKMFPGKFEKAPANAKLTEPDRKLEDDGPVEGEGNQKNLLTLKQARLAENAAAGDEEAEEELEKEMAKPVKKDDKDDKEEKAPAKVTKSTSEDEEESEEEDEEEDVTDRFKAASDVDLTVHHSAAGFVVKDGGKVVSKETMNTKAKVNKFLKGYSEKE